MEAFLALRCRVLVAMVIAEGHKPTWSFYVILDKCLLGWGGVVCNAMPGKGLASDGKGHR